MIISAAHISSCSTRLLVHVETMTTGIILKLSDHQEKLRVNRISLMPLMPSQTHLACEANILAESKISQLVGDPPTFYAQGRLLAQGYSKTKGASGAMDTILLGNIWCLGDTKEGHNDIEPAI